VISLTRIPDTRTLMSHTLTAGAERRRVLQARVAVVAVVWMLSGLSAVSLAAHPQVEPAPPAAAAPAAQPQEAHPPAAAPAGQPGQEAGGEHGGAEGEAAHAESPWALIARLFNFALLAGALVYLLRSPLMTFLAERGVQVRNELTKAAALRKEAGGQLAQVDAKMKALPNEIEALKRRGAEDIGAEGERMRGQIEAERRRMLDHAKRDIENELHLAERELKKRAGELAVDVATERVKRTITDRDQARLVDRYVEQVRH